MLWRECKVSKSLSAGLAYISLLSVIFFISGHFIMPTMRADFPP